MRKSTRQVWLAFALLIVCDFSVGQVTANLQVDPRDGHVLELMAALPGGQAANLCYFSAAFEGQQAHDMDSCWTEVNPGGTPTQACIWRRINPIKSPRLTWQSCRAKDLPPTPSLAITEKVFTNGLRLQSQGREKDFAFGKSYEEINALFVYPFTEHYTELPRATEYQTNNIHYVFIPVGALPILPTLFPDGIRGAGSRFYWTPDTYISFVFKNDQLFHLSIRLKNLNNDTKYYQAFFDRFFGPSHKLSFSAPGGYTTIIVAHQAAAGQYSVVDVTRSGVDNDDESIAK